MLQSFYTTHLTFVSNSAVRTSWSRKGAKYKEEGTIISKTDNQVYKNRTVYYEKYCFLKDKVQHKFSLR